MSKIERIYLGGTFDCLHSGHINLFKNASAKGWVIVSVNTDEFAESYKRRPVMPLKERLAVLSQLRCVDEVIINIGGADSKPAIIEAKATQIWHGDDWTGEGLMKQMGLTQEFLDQQGMVMHYEPYTLGISTTQILKNLHN